MGTVLDWPNQSPDPNPIAHTSEEETEERNTPKAKKKKKQLNEFRMTFFTKQKG